MTPIAIIILAAGRGKRWGQVTNKVLVDIKGEPLITRTCRLAREVFGEAPTVVTIEDDVSRAIGQSHFLVPHKYRWTVETLLNTHTIWDGRVIVLLGDTYYTERTLNLIKHTDLPVCYFGRLLEIYAMSFSYLVTVFRLLLDAIGHAEQNAFPSNRP